MRHKIRLTGLEVYANHGVFDFEREAGQLFIIDATLVVELDEQVLADDISKTVNYGTLADDLVMATRSESVNLLETLAQRLLLVCLSAPGAKVVKAKVTVHKPQAPIAHNFRDVAVTVKGRNG